MQPPSDQDRLKQLAAEAAAAQVTGGMVVGLGTGSTAAFVVAALGRSVAEGLRIIGIPTSEQTARQARSLGIPLSTLAEHPRADIAIDGADEVEAGSLNLIKGHGGALLREKIVACASDRLMIVVDESKLVRQLGERYQVPVEVVPFGWPATAKHLRDLGAQVTLRLQAGGQPFVSEGGHYILDCAFGAIASPATLQRELDSTVGLVEHGLFLGLTSQVFVGTTESVKILVPERA